MEIPCAAELTDLLGITRTTSIMWEVLPAKTFQVFISGFSQKCHKPLKITPAYQRPKAVSAQILRRRSVNPHCGWRYCASDRMRRRGSSPQPTPNWKGLWHQGPRGETSQRHSNPWRITLTFSRYNLQHGSEGLQSSLGHGPQKNTICVTAKRRKV